MSEEPGTQLQEEPQDERGGPGSRDKGDVTPGSQHRPADTSDARDHTSVDPQDANDDAPNLQTP
ncbi:MAG: hypothetical protein QOF87_4140 [Pseudonocardiales bacterium]|jgi:hypothetical protein|nr:hypothetical protein [Pseudonocardiales bacterium]MDT4910537.1 hypothetical protein [Pseudonocardiales bacterium]MDT4959982.1 hypothetical protein [Pseudonocardiales bacterium]MDT4964493.1 hypothetical protein [Pseudonocardiales bacterium]MDT4972858.1 hypothetical protein [Pseudonocardiales bacterium]